MTQFPEAFDGVRCLIAAQPVTARTIIERRLAGLGLAEHITDLEQRIIVRTGINFARRSPLRATHLGYCYAPADQETSGRSWMWP